MNRPWPTECSFASYLIRVRFNANVESKFISFFINSAYGRTWIRSVVSQQVGQANVNGSRLQDMTLLLPSQQEQKKIVSEVEAKISTTNFIEKSLDESLSRTSHLRQSILNKAFSGKLVPQDPNDEPAAVLLERIRMQKEKQKDGGKGKKTA